MAWNEPGGDKDPWGGRGGDQGPPDLDEALKKLQGQLSGIFGGRGNSSGRRWWPKQGHGGWHCAAGTAGLCPHRILCG